MVLLNPKSGTLANSATHDEPQRIAAGFAARGIEAVVQSVDYERLEEEIEQAKARGTAAVIVGGGDGTINTVANIVSRKGIALGVLPLGTHNHFAKEMGVPADLDAGVTALADALANGRVEPIDVADVNGTLFLNFSAIGLHPAIVEQREEDHEQIKRLAILRTVLRRFTKPFALLVAFIKSLRDFPVLRVWLDFDGRRLRRFTPSLIVGNNVHQIEVFGLTEVSAPHREVLNIYVARSRTGLGLLRLVLAAFTRQLASMRDFESLATSKLTVHHRRSTLKASIDGEIVQLRTPLVYGIRSGALNVIRPDGQNEPRTQ